MCEVTPHVMSYFCGISWHFHSSSKKFIPTMLVGHGHHRHCHHHSLQMLMKLVFFVKLPLLVLLLPPPPDIVYTIDFILSSYYSDIASTLLWYSLKNLEYLWYFGYLGHSEYLGYLGLVKTDPCHLVIHFRFNGS